jgi:DNA-binding CsgD family transcriptional regulator
MAGHYDVAAVAADYRLRIEAARARLNQALITEQAPAGSLPPWTELVRDALDCLGALPERADGRRRPYNVSTAKGQPTMITRGLVNATTRGPVGTKGPLRDPGWAKPEPVTPLSPMQLKVVAQLALGKTRREAGEALGLTESTIKSHLLRARTQTGLTPKQLVSTALREGWVA